MPFEQSLLSVLAGGLVGLSLGLLGGGGSILAVPLLLYLVRLKDAHIVIGTSALAVGINALINLWTHARDGHVRFKPAIAFSIPGVAGAAIGSELGKRLHGATLLFLFAILMFVIAGLMLKRGHQHNPPKRGAIPSDAQPPQFAVPPEPHIRWIPIAVAGFLVGGLSGFFGIGGGFLIVPGLIFSANLPFIEAIGTSLFAVGAFGITTAVNYSLAGLINWLVFFEFILGGAAGGILGAKLASRLSQRRAALNDIFAAVVIVVALYMLYKNAVAIHL